MALILYLNIDKAFRGELPYLVNVAMTLVLQCDHQAFYPGLGGACGGMSQGTTQFLSWHA